MMPSASYIVGGCRVDITPPPSIPYLGWYPHRHARFASIHDPLHARCVYLSDGERSAAIVSLDLIGLPEQLQGPRPNLLDDIRSAVAAGCSIPHDAVMVSCTHAHSTPETLGIRALPADCPDARQWMGMLVSQVHVAASEAKRTAFEARLHIARGSVPGVSHNRRGESQLDDELILLTLRSDDGRCVFLIQFACHPVIVQTQDQVSGDFPGALCCGLEQRVPGLKACLFLQGASGDVNPVAETTRDFDDVALMADALAGQVLQLDAVSRMRSRVREVVDPLRPDATPTPARSRREVPARVQAMSRRLSLPSRPLPAPDEVTRIRRALSHDKGCFKDTHEECQRERLAIAIGGREEILRRMEQGTGPFPAKIQLLRIGAAVFCGIPGELPCAGGIRLKMRGGDLIAIPVGCANGYCGYMFDEQGWAKSGYETRCGPWSLVDASAYRRVIEEIEDMLGLLSDDVAPAEGE